jgi:hypothetical protein
MIVRISKTWSAVVTAVVMFGSAAPLFAHEPTGAPPALPASAVQGSTLLTPPATVKPAATSRPITAAAKPEDALAPVALDDVKAKEQDGIVLAGRRADGSAPTLSRREEKQLMQPVVVGAPGTTGVPVTAGAPVSGSGLVIQGMPAPSPAPAAQYAPIPSGTVVYDSSSPQPYTDDGTHGSQITQGTTAFPQDCEASIRITDRPYTGACPPYGELKKRDLRMVCPECRIAPDGLPYHMSECYDPTERQIRRYTHMHGLVYPPDYGWCPPGKLPIDYVSVDYNRQFPGSWYGQPATCGVIRPQVYWPTDTTQLGYTYQHVPRWLPAYGMVPPVPHPDQWNIPHCTLCGADCRGCGRHNGLCQSCRTSKCQHGTCPTGTCPSGQAGNCPTCQPGVIIEDGSSVEQPTPSESLPPIAPKALPPQSATLPGGLDLNASSATPSLVPVPN